jgi:hypothetical protein
MKILTNPNLMVLSSLQFINLNKKLKLITFEIKFHFFESTFTLTVA